MKAKLAVCIGAILYGSLALNATPARAAGLGAEDVAALKAARTGDMKKLVIHDAPRSRLETPFETATGEKITIEDFGGKMLVVNFWATWCPPCRKEMPSLDRLRAQMAGDDFELIAISMDSASTEKIEAFFNEIPQAGQEPYTIEHLAIYREPTMRIGAEGAIPGLPVTLVLNPQGEEIARLQGEAEWDSPEAIRMLEEIIAANARAGE